eukprot:6363308-Alexandrium_andersonii.AAC.1
MNLNSEPNTYALKSGGSKGKPPKEHQRVEQLRRLQAGRRRFSGGPGGRWPPRRWSARGC